MEELQRAVRGLHGHVPRRGHCDPLATIATQEHARLSERVVAGLRRAKREGKVPGRKRIIVGPERIRHARQWSVGKGDCRRSWRVEVDGGEYREQSTQRRQR